MYGSLYLFNKKGLQADAHRPFIHHFHKSSKLITLYHDVTTVNLSRQIRVIVYAHLVVVDDFVSIFFVPDFEAKEIHFCAWCLCCIYGVEHTKNKSSFLTVL